MSKPTAAPHRFPYCEHRTMSAVMERERINAEDASAEFVRRLLREQKREVA